MGKGKNALSATGIGIALVVLSFLSPLITVPFGGIAFFTGVFSLVVAALLATEKPERTLQERERGLTLQSGALQTLTLLEETEPRKKYWLESHPLLLGFSTTGLLTLAFLYDLFYGRFLLIYPIPCYFLLTLFIDPVVYYNCAIKAKWADPNRLARDFCIGAIIVVGVFLLIMAWLFVEAFFYGMTQDA